MFVCFLGSLWKRSDPQTPSIPAVPYTLHFTVPADVVGVSRLPKPHHQPQFHIHTPRFSPTNHRGKTFVSPPPSRQMPPNGHPLLPNSGRLLVPVSEGCCRVHNANIQGIHVNIQPLFPGEAVLLCEPGGRNFGGVCNTDGGRAHSCS